MTNLQTLSRVIIWASCWWIPNCIYLQNSRCRKCWKWISWNWKIIVYICPTWLIMSLWYVLSRSVIGSVTVYLGLSVVWVKLGEWKKGRVRWKFVYFHVQVKCSFTSIFLCYHGNFSLKHNTKNTKIPIYSIPLKVYSSIKKGSHKSVKLLYTQRTGCKCICRPSTSQKKDGGTTCKCDSF